MGCGVRIGLRRLPPRLRAPEKEFQEKMTRYEDIHQSVSQADDIEQVRESEIPISEVLRSLVSHPLQIITRWNWKAALLGAVLRASFYFTVYQAARENMRAAL